MPALGSPQQAGQDHDVDAPSSDSSSTTTTTTTTTATTSDAATIPNASVATKKQLFCKIDCAFGREDEKSCRMVACAFCSQYFHLSCVKIHKNASMHAIWACDRCTIRLSSLLSHVASLEKACSTLAARVAILEAALAPATVGGSPHPAPLAVVGNLPAAGPHLLGSHPTRFSASAAQLNRIIDVTPTGPPASADDNAPPPHSAAGSYAAIAAAPMSASRAVPRGPRRTNRGRPGTTPKGLANQHPGQRPLPRQIVGTATGSLQHSLLASDSRITIFLSRLNIAATDQDLLDYLTSLHIQPFSVRTVPQRGRNYKIGFFDVARQHLTAALDSSNWPPGIYFDVARRSAAQHTFTGTRGTGSCQDPAVLGLAAVDAKTISISHVQDSATEEQVRLHLEALGISGAIVEKIPPTSLSAGYSTFHATLHSQGVETAMNPANWDAGIEIRLSRGAPQGGPPRPATRS